LISPSAMDDLLRCPMRYWFSQAAGLKGLDEESELEDRRQIGTVVHRALHKFGGEGGFQRLKMDISKAAALLSGALEQACAEQNIRLSDDLLQSNGLKYYSRGLSELRENNLLVKLLRWNAENLQDFTPVYFEKEFGDEKSEGLWQEVEMSGRGLKLRFQGRVDKIMISADEAAALASDYKTGEVEIKDIREYWSSQFPIYYLALKKAFPGKRIILVYEVLKSLQKSGIAALFGETQPGDEQMLSRSYKTKILTLDDTGENLSMREIEEAYISAAKSALEGDFHIAGRELYGKACEHCDYAALCRRDCVVTY